MEGRVKQTHMIIETILIILSGLVFFPLSKNTHQFSHNCLLNSKILVNRFSNHSVSLNLEGTVFGEQGNCDYTTFVNVMVAIHALVWVWFFFHHDTLASYKRSSLNLLLPSLVTHFIFLLLVIVSSVKIDSGFEKWCDSIVNNNEKLQSEYECKDYEDLHWVQGFSNFYTFCQMAQVSSWLIVVFLIISMGATCVHIHWDFMSTYYVPQHDSKSVLPSFEASGFSENEVGAINKGALGSSFDNFYESSMDERPITPVSRSYQNYHDGDPDDVLVSATVHHNNSDFNSRGVGSTISLDQRSSTHSSGQDLASQARNRTRSNSPDDLLLQ